MLARAPRPAVGVFLFAVLFCVARPAGDAGAAGAVGADDWKLLSNDHGITVYSRQTPGSSIVALKGTGTIDAPLWKIASILLDTKRATEWADSLKESRVVRRIGPAAYVEFNHIGLPLILKDRDFVSEVRIDVDPDAKAFALVYKPAADPIVPATHDVRGEIVSGSFRLTSLEKARRVSLDAEVQCDPKGAIPAWIVNFFQKSWPRNTFQALQKQAAKPDITIPEEFRDLLVQTLEF
jgi:hypothetical protein